MDSYECTIRTRKGPVVFWAKAGQYLWVDTTGHGGGQACDGGRTGLGHAISVGGGYTTLTQGDFRRICRRWLRQRAKRMRAARSQAPGRQPQVGSPR